jgi:signal transduction histidine kinase
MQGDTTGRQEQETIAALVQLASAGLGNWEVALQQILRIDAQVLRVERVGFWSFRENPPSLFCDLVFRRGMSAFERGQTLHLEDNRAYFAELQVTSLLAASDACHDPRTRELASLLQGQGVVSRMDIPIRNDGKLAGVLCHGHVGEAREWSAQDRQFGLAVSQSVVAALQARARTYAEKLERGAAFLAGASWSLAQTHDPQEVADRAVEAALPMLGDEVALIRFDGDKAPEFALATRSAEGRRRWEALMGRFPPTFEGRNPISELLRRGRSLLIPWVTDETVDLYEISPEEREMARALVNRSLAAVLLQADYGPQGAIVFTSTLRAFDQDDLRLAEEYARRVSAALGVTCLLAKLKESIRAREQFITLASHELSTPLTSLRLAVDALDRGLATGPERIGQVTCAVVRQTDRLERLVGRLIDSCEIGIGSLSIQRGSVDLAEVARKVVDQIRGQCWQSSALHVDASAPVPVEGDSRRLGQLTFELLDNAIKFGDGKPVDLAVHAADHGAVLSVRDRGRGIAPERREEIFDRFQRSDLSTRSFGGLGLGLYVARAIATAHGGTIRVESRPGEGATFIVEVPGPTATAGGNHG